MAAAEAVLQIDDLQARYGASHVLQGVTLDVARGAVTALVGRNGAGKTTLVNAVMGLIPAAGGMIVYAGGDITRQPATARRGLGIALVPQGRRIFRSLTVEEHLALVNPSPRSPWRRERLYDVFPRLRERRQSLASTLSGGEQSMLAIARALTADPRLLVMDEPTEGLALLLVETVREVVAGVVGEGVTVLLVEQNLGFALSLADQVAIMERGRIARVMDRAEVGDAAALGAVILGGIGDGPRM